MNEERRLRVCEHCLWGIESHEGAQITKRLWIDIDEDEGEDGKCDWCEETGFDVLYEIY